MEEPETRDTWVVTGAPKLCVPGGGGRQELEYFEKLAWVVLWLSPLPPLTHPS